MGDFQQIANFLWSIADEVLRDDFKRSKYPDIILPLTVLRRVDCVLEPTKEAVLKKHKELIDKGLKTPDDQLKRVAGRAFYNTSRYDFSKLLDDPKNIGKNMIAYINAFSENMRDIIDKFNLREYINQLDSKGLLFLLVQKFSSVNLHPDEVSNHEMGTVFEELIRRFNEQANENPGEHFTPREVIRLMVRLLVNGDKPTLGRKEVVRSVYDPACGTGGMLSVTKEYIQEHINPHASIHLFGQEVNNETYAVCKSDMLIKGDDRDADNIKYGSSFSLDGHADQTFDYMISNPPYGKDWKKEKDYIEAEASRGFSGRFGPGLPRISDGQLLFLLQMLSKMKKVDEGGSRIAIIMNGSPLFTGDAGSGESEIRRYVLENDLLESIVALPGQLFYNTGITTYIWVLTNRKNKKRKGRVLLVNGVATCEENGKEVEVFAHKMHRSLGDKRNELGEEDIIELARLSNAFEEGSYTKVFVTSDFGYRKITVERPLQLRFQITSEGLEMLKETTAFKNLAVSKKKGAAAEKEMGEGRILQEGVVDMLGLMDGSIVYKSRDAFVEELDKALKNRSIRIPTLVKKAILDSFSERDEEAEICRDSRGEMEPDSELRDYENMPLKENVQDYFEREVLPHVPDAWINEGVRDPNDGQVGKVGYEINFNRYFYFYKPPRPLEEIEAELQSTEEEITNMLKEMSKK